MKRSSSIVWGLLFILLGAFLIADRVLNLHLASMNVLWPLFILVPGLVFEFSYFLSRSNPGLLVPGGILTTIGALFMFETLTPRNFWGYTWPIYPLAVAIGLYQLYIFGGRERGLLVPVTILGGFSAAALVSMLFSTDIMNVLIPAVLIILGAYIIIKGQKR